jgi:hypothetical protein
MKTHNAAHPFGGIIDFSISPDEIEKQSRKHYRPCMDAIKKATNGYLSQLYFPGRKPDSFLQASWLT